MTFDEHEMRIRSALLHLGECVRDAADDNVTVKCAVDQHSGYELPLLTLSRNLRIIRKGEPPVPTDE